MVDNFDLIRSLLKFRSEDDFYFIQILQRKKDHEESKVNGTNNNSRLIKAYYIKSLEHFDFVKPEIIEMCKLFNARAGINLNRRSFEKTAFQHLRKVADQIINKDFKHGHKAYSSVVGTYAHESDIHWIVDVDDVELDDEKCISYISYINKCMPKGDKFICRIPSKSGYHLIVKPFDLSKFRSQFPEVEIHKNNPTNLYIP